MNPADMAVLAGAALAMSEPEFAHGLLTVTVEPTAWLPALEWARDELDCSVFDFLRGVDALDADLRGIRVVAHLHGPSGCHHLLLHTLVPAGAPCLPTATGLFRDADWHERKTHEMFGVIFTGHPGLDPLLLPDGCEGHLRHRDLVAGRVALPRSSSSVWW